MKKLSIYLMLAFAGLFMAACSEDNEFAGLTVVTPEDAIEIPGFQAVAAPAIDLADYADDDVVRIFSLAEANLPEGYSVENIRIFVNPVDDPTNKVKFDTDGTFTKAELQSFVESIYGKRPEARTFQAQVYASVVDANGAAVNVDAGVITLTITPEAPYIAQNYYLVGGPMDWAGSAASKEQQFSHSDADVYDDPVFTYLLTAAGETWFAIGDDEACDAIANDGNWSLLLGTTSGNGNNGESGFLAPRTQLADDGSFKVPAGTYLISLNMMDYTYTITPVASRFYMVGAKPGWNADAAFTALFFPEGNNVFSYTTVFSSGDNLKIWGEDDLGNWDVAYGATEDNSTAEIGSLINSGAGAIMVPQEGVFTLQLDLNSMQYEWRCLDLAPTEYESIGIIGGFNGWGSIEPMTQVTPHNWYGSFWFEEDTQLKFRIAQDWSMNWGFQNENDWTVSESAWANTCTKDAGNIYVPAGGYNFYFNDITGNACIVPSLDK